MKKFKKWLVMMMATVMMITSAIPVSANELATVAPTTQVTPVDNVALIEYYIKNLDIDSYKKLNPDLVAAFGDNTPMYVLHYALCGIYEGRRTGSWDPVAFVINNRQAIIEQTMAGSVQFLDIEKYKKAYPDVAKAFGNDKLAIIMHYLNHGIMEGRRSCAAFDPTIFAYNHPKADLRTNGSTEQLKNAYHVENSKVHSSSGSSSSGGSSSSSSSNSNSGQVKPSNKYVIDNFKLTYYAGEDDGYSMEMPDGIHYLNLTDEEVTFEELWQKLYSDTAVFIDAYEGQTIRCVTFVTASDFVIDEEAMTATFTITEDRFNNECKFAEGLDTEYVISYEPVGEDFVPPVEVPEDVYTMTIGTDVEIELPTTVGSLIDAGFNFENAEDAIVEIYPGFEDDLTLVNDTGIELTIMTEVNKSGEIKPIDEMLVKQVYAEVNIFDENNVVSVAGVSTKDTVETMHTVLGEALEEFGNRATYVYKVEHLNVTIDYFWNEGIIDGICLNVLTDEYLEAPTNPNGTTPDGIPEDGFEGMVIDGTELTFPVTYESIISAGFIPDIEGSTMVTADEDIIVYLEHASIDKLYAVGVIKKNTSGETLTVADATFDTLVINSAVAVEEVAYKGIEIGGTYEDVISVFGNKYYVENGSIIYTYTFDNTTLKIGVLFTPDMHVAGFAYEMSDFVEEPGTDVPPSYPTELSDDIKSNQFSIREGDVIQLPVTVSELIDRGYYISADVLATEIEANDTARVILYPDSESTEETSSVILRVTNFSGEAAPVNDLIVMGAEWFDEHLVGNTSKLPCGIDLSMTYAEIIEAAGMPNKYSDDWENEAPYVQYFTKGADDTGLELFDGDSVTFIFSDAEDSEASTVEESTLMNVSMLAFRDAYSLYNELNNVIPEEDPAEWNEIPEGMTYDTFRSIMINGVTYELACTLGTFEDNGFSLPDDLNFEGDEGEDPVPATFEYEVEGYQGISALPLTSAAGDITVTIINPSSTTKEIRDCYVCAVNITTDFDEVFDEYLGLTADATLDDFEELLGEALETEDAGSYIVKTYKYRPLHDNDGSYPKYMGCEATFGTDGALEQIKVTMPVPVESPEQMLVEPIESITDYTLEELTRIIVGGMPIGVPTDVNTLFASGFEPIDTDEHDLLTDATVITNGLSAIGDFKRKRETVDGMTIKLTAATGVNASGEDSTVGDMKFRTIVLEAVDPTNITDALSNTVYYLDLPIGSQVTDVMDSLGEVETAELDDTYGTFTYEVVKDTATVTVTFKYVLDTEVVYGVILDIEEVQTETTTPNPEDGSSDPETGDDTTTGLAIEDINTNVPTLQYDDLKSADELTIGNSVLEVLE